MIASSETTSLRCSPRKIKIEKIKELSWRSKRVQISSITKINFLGCTLTHFGVKVKRGHLMLSPVFRIHASMTTCMERARRELFIDMTVARYRGPNMGGFMSLILLVICEFCEWGPKTTKCYSLEIEVLWETHWKDPWVLFSKNAFLFLATHIMTTESVDNF